MFTWTPDKDHINETREQKKDKEEEKEKKKKKKKNLEHLRPCTTTRLMPQHEWFDYEPLTLGHSLVHIFADENN